MQIDYLKIFETMPYDFRLQEHILSHFLQLNQKYRTLIKANCDISEEDIKLKLLMTGSKFYESFANNPIALYKKILSGYKNNNIAIIKRGAKTDLTITYPHEIYKSGIGMEGIMNINELSERECLKIETKTRKGINIKTLSRKKKAVWKLNIIIDRNLDKEYFIKTIFPGKMAPPFPDKEFQNDREYHISSEFWDNHIFLI